MELNQLTVPVTNLERSIGFYERLGLRLIVKAAHYARFECPTGASTFSLNVAEKPQPDAHLAVYFEVENVDRKVAELLDLGFFFDEMPADKSWLWREARLRDPDGLRIILFHAGENRKNPPWRL